MKHSILFVYFLLLSLFSFGQKNDFPPRPNPPRLVNDLANMLTPSEKQALEQKLVNYNDSTSTQIAIVTITSIGEYEIADYADRLGEQWGVGGKNNDNGVLILVAKDERKVTLRTGYGMEHLVPDAKAKEITEYVLKPNFQQGEFYKGLNDATDVVITRAMGAYKADPASSYQGEGEGGGPSIFLIILIIMVIIFFISRRGGGKGGGKGRYARTLGGPILIPGGFGTFRSGGGIFGGGGGGFGGGGGGFGGFGGGGFGGGGASSSW